ncbi:MAG: diacylglycerol kinase family protein [Ferruginibacter sp.]
MKRLIKSFSFAISGINHCFSKEPNFYIHILLATAALSLSILLEISRIEFIVVILCIAVVLAAEMINTAIEQICNRVTRERDTEIKIIKDISAGAVLVTAIASLVCGLIIFVPKLYALVN